MSMTYRIFKRASMLLPMSRPTLRSVATLATLVALTGAFDRLPAQEMHPYRPGIDVLDYALVIDLPDTGSLIRGDATITILRVARVDTLVLDLRPLAVQPVTRDARTPKVTH